MKASFVVAPHQTKPILPTSVLIALLLFLFLPGTTPLAGQIVYSNTGSNTNGFISEFSTGTMVSDGTYIVEATGGSWDLLPFTVTGNFQISFQVYNDSYDGDSHLLLLDPTSNGGYDVRNSPQGTDTPNINIFSGTDFTNYNQFFFPTAAATLATATSLDFPNLTWTQITITMQNGILTDNVGGQLLQVDLSKTNLPASFRVALGAYATTIDPRPGVDNSLTGEILFRNFVATPEPSAWWLVSASLLTGLFSYRFAFRYRPAS